MTPSRRALQKSIVLPIMLVFRRLGSGLPVLGASFCASHAKRCRSGQSVECSERFVPMSGVHLGQHFEVRLSTLQAGGPQQLQVITDFDQTLTAYIGNDGLRNDECHGLLLRRLEPRTVPGLMTTSWKHLKELERLYGEGDFAGADSYARSLDIQGKRVTWWFKTYQRLAVEFQLWRHVDDCTIRSNARVRDGLVATFAWLEAFDVPLLVVSAGLRQVMCCILETRGCPLPASASIVANDLREPTLTIYTETKHAALSLAPQRFHDAVKDRRCVLLLGDKQSDLAPAQGLDQDSVVLSICFLSDGLSERRSASAEEIQKHLQYFDVVLTGDASMNFVNSLLRSIEGGG